MSKDFRSYFTGNNKELQEALLDGYVAALKRNKVYDPALFLTDHQLETHVVADLVTQEKRAEDAQRAQARITANIFGNHIITDETKEELRKMITSPSKELPTSDTVEEVVDDIITELIFTNPSVFSLSEAEKSVIVENTIRKYCETGKLDDLKD